MDIFHMPSAKSTTFHKMKKQHPVYEDKNDTRRKAVVVGRIMGRWEG